MSIGLCPHGAVPDWCFRCRDARRCAAARTRAAVPTHRPPPAAPAYSEPPPARLVPGDGTAAALHRAGVPVSVEELERRMLTPPEPVVVAPPAPAAPSADTLAAARRILSAAGVTQGGPVDPAEAASKAARLLGKRRSEPAPAPAPPVRRYSDDTYRWLAGHAKEALKEFCLPKQPAAPAPPPVPPLEQPPPASPPRAKQTPGYVGRGKVAGSRQFVTAPQAGAGMWVKDPVEVQVVGGDFVDGSMQGPKPRAAPETLWIVQSGVVAQFDLLPGTLCERLPVWISGGMVLYSLGGWWRVTMRHWEINKAAPEPIPKPGAPPRPYQTVRVPLLPGEILGCEWADEARTIISWPGDDTPAQRAGLRTGQQIIAVGGGRGHSFHRRCGAGLSSADDACAELPRVNLEMSALVGVDADTCGEGHTHQMRLQFTSGESCWFCGKEVTNVRRGFGKCAVCGQAICGECSRRPDQIVTISLPRTGEAVGWHMWRGTSQIAKVIPGSAAEAAGIRAGMTVRALGSVCDATLSPVDRAPVADAVVRALAGSAAVAELTVVDNSGTMLASATPHKGLLPHECRSGWLSHGQDPRQENPFFLDRDVVVSSTDPAIREDSVAAAVAAALAVLEFAAGSAPPKKKKAGGKKGKKGDGAESPAGEKKKKKKDGESASPKAGEGDKKERKKKPKPDPPP
eukprot:TRINITY_DN4199_c0_g1_i1.p1 TRINITY_DN4199_c0_g1~~TRINITY_DN4199_c0_g1_i1.p1  ORF type:complete len:684 (+),score=192.58 TRINITY_DN4199_c0_g1_i1:62-2113(+)